MSRYDDLVAAALTRVRELMPWDLSKRLAAGDAPVLHILGQREHPFWTNVNTFCHSPE